MGHTKGNWGYDINANKGFDVFVKGSIKIIATVLTKDVSYMPDKKEAEANAQLIAEAGTVANETGMTPKEMQSQLIGLKAAAPMLQEQNKELLEALKAVNKRLNQKEIRCQTYAETEVLIIVETAIKKAHETSL